MTDCKPDYNPSSKPQVRLVGGSSLLEGRVEVSVWEIKTALVKSP